MTLSHTRSVQKDIQKYNTQHNDAEYGSNEHKDTDNNPFVRLLSIFTLMLSVILINVVMLSVLTAKKNLPVVYL